jgi:hypothetical protein
LGQDLVFLVLLMLRVFDMLQSPLWLTMMMISVMTTIDDFDDVSRAMERNFMIYDA